MNSLLNDVANDISNQINNVSSLFDVIHLLPPHDEIPSIILESDDIEVEALSNQLTRLMKLETSKSFEASSDKYKDIMGEVG